MRLLCLTSSYPLASAPASGVFVGSLVNALREAGQQVSVITPAPPNNGKTDDVVTLRYAPRRWQRLAHVPGGIPEQLKASPLNYIWLLCMVLVMAWAVRRQLKKTDLVLANWSLCGLAAILGTAFSGVPVVTVLRGSDVNRTSSGPGYWLLHLCVGFSDALVCVSPSMRDALVGRFPHAEEKVMVIKNGVDDFSMRKSPPFSSVDRLPQLLFVGNLTANKGVDTIAEALVLLRRAGVGFRMGFVGGGDPNVCMPKECLAELAGCVKFYGVQPHECVMDLLACADLFVNASRSEGRSNAILEALAAGVPVIASDIAPNKELLKGSEWGVLFPVGNAGTLKDAIMEVLKEPQLAIERALIARQAITSDCQSWSVCAEQYLALFSEMLHAS